MREKISHIAWPLIGLGVAAFCIWLLVRELQSISLDDVMASLGRVPPLHWLGAFMGAIVAYGALAAYDRISLLHLGHKLPWPFITITSFVAYALSHNIGAAVLSGAVIRYRAYSTRGLTAAEVGVLVALCAFTFGLGLIILGGILLLIEPELAQRFVPIPVWGARLVGVGCLAAVAFYVAGSLLRLPPLTIGSFKLFYPRPPIVWRQLIIGPIELIGAAAIVYFSLPVEGNPGYLVVLGIFVASFGAAIFSHAPGGIGVLEFLFITALPTIPPADVLASMIVFRLFYLVIPLAISVVAVLVFERQQIALRRQGLAPAASSPGTSTPSDGTPVV